MTERAVIYGGSLYDLAVEEGRAGQILEELTEVFKLFRENPDYLTLLLEPSIKKDKRLELIEEAFGSSCDRYLVNFLKLLCERGLLREFEGCRETFIKRYNRDNNISEALVTSAVALTEQQLAALREKLEKNTGRKIDIKTKVDASVLAGLKVEIDGKQYDGTVSTRLESIHRKLSETII